MFGIKMRVKEVMKHARTVAFDATVKEAAILMDKYSMGSLVVINDKKRVVGIVTERDFLQKVTVKDKIPSKISIRDIMTPKIISIDSESLLDDAVYLMIKHRIKKLPVIDNHELVGILTATDIVANSSEIGEFYLFD